MQHGAVKTAARLDDDPSSPRQGPTQASVQFSYCSTATAAELKDGQATGTSLSEWQHQQRQQHSDETVTAASGTQLTPRRAKVKFAADPGPGDPTGAAAAATAAAVHDSSKQRHVHIASTASSHEAEEGSDAQGGAAADHAPTAAPTFLDRFRKSFADSRSQRQEDGNNSRRLQHAASSKQGDKHAAAQEAEQEVAVTHAKSQAVPSIFSASLKGFLGGASSRLLGSWMGRSGTANTAEAEAEQEEEDLWFTSLDDFKPICHMLHKGKYMSAYFACANKTGQHFLLKKFDKHKMLPAEERGVRRSIAFSELLQHQNLVKCMGQWEAEDIIYVVEEYAGKGDAFNDAISHPEKYTERYVAVTLVKPLLKVLAYLHANNIIHRSVLPENLYMAIDDVLKLGHLTLAVDQLSDRPKSRTALLDYMAPEMLSVKPHNEHELAHALEDSSDDEEPLNREIQHAAEQGLAEGRQSSGPVLQQCQQQQQQQQLSGQHEHHNQRQQQHHGQLDVLGRPLTDPVQQQHHLKQHAAADTSTLATVTNRCNSKTGPRSRNGFMKAAGQAEWEYMDYYDEKVDIWQVGCMVHELLCGSMPFEIDSKVDSGGLALWADIEQPPGSLPPDCVKFLQLALTKDPKQRPAAEQLMQHPWLARCEAGEPWRDPAELEAARKAAELATISGWLRHNSRAVVAGVSGFMQRVLHGSRVQPMALWVDHHQQQAESFSISTPASPRKRQMSNNCSLAHAAGEGGVPGSRQAPLHLPPHQFKQQQSWDLNSMRQQVPDHLEAQSAEYTHQHDHSNGSRPVPRITVPLKLTEELVGKLNAGWEAEQRSLSGRGQPVGSQGSAADSVEQVGQPEDGDDLDDEVQAACVIQVPRTSPFAQAAIKRGVGFSLMPQEALDGDCAQPPLQQQPQLDTLGMV